MPDEIAIDSGGSSMVRDMKTVPTDMPLLRSIQVLERYFMLQCIHVYPRALFSLAGTSRPCMTYKRNPFFPLYKLGVPSRFDFGRTGVLRAMLKFVLWLRILMCPDIYHNHVFVIDKDTAH